MSHLERVFEHGDDDRSADVSVESARSLAGGEFQAYLRARESVVSSLARDVAGVVRRAGSALTFCDLSGAAKGYATGEPEGTPTAEYAWRFGVDLHALATECDAISVCGYATDPERVRADLEAYVEHLGEPGPLTLTLRPFTPDCDSSDNLRAKLLAARELGVSHVDFYHYGLARLSALDWIREALRWS